MHYDERSCLLVPAWRYSNFASTTIARAMPRWSMRTASSGPTLSSFRVPILRPGSGTQWARERTQAQQPVQSHNKQMEIGRIVETRAFAADGRPCVHCIAIHAIRSRPQYETGLRSHLGNAMLLSPLHFCISVGPEALRATLADFEGLAGVCYRRSPM